MKNSQLKFYLIAINIGLLQPLQQLNATINITLPTIDEPTYRVLREYTDATLAGINSKIPPGTVQGNHVYAFRMDYTLRGHREDCCVDEKDGEKWVIDPASDQLDFVFVTTRQPIISLPAWSMSGSVCAIVQAEWDRYLQLVTEHENGHQSVLLAFFSETNMSSIQEIFDYEVVRDESGCVEGVGQNLQEVSESLYERVDESVDNARNQVHGAINGEQNNAHETLPYGNINPAIVCP